MTSYLAVHGQGQTTQLYINSTIELASPDALKEFLNPWGTIISADVTGVHDICSLQDDSSSDNAMQCWRSISSALIIDGTTAKDM